MSQVLTISDTLYRRLEEITRQRGLRSVEELLEAWQAAEDERRRRQQAVQEIDAVRQQMFTTYGQMPDSVYLLREDRQR
jgi:hypothetical protein